MTKIIFINYQVGYKLRNKKDLRSFFANIFKKEGFIAEEIKFIFCSDKYLKALNKDYLKHNYYTDILTFVLSEQKKPIVSEIYISIDRIKENSVYFKSSFKEELHRVMIHGVLHLCGYNDHLKKEKSIIREKENMYLKSICFT